MPRTGCRLVGFAPVGQWRFCQSRRALAGLALCGGLRGCRLRGCGLFGRWLLWRVFGLWRGGVGWLGGLIGLVALGLWVGYRRFWRFGAGGFQNLGGTRRKTTFLLFRFNNKIGAGR